MKTKLPRKLITFDWAMKRLLRSKANFEILEGFLSELLNDDIVILELLESESNKESATDKDNRVDLKVKNSAGELAIIGIRNEREFDYLHRIFCETSQDITERQQADKQVSLVKKAIFLTIIYFDLGRGSDYIYRGDTNFIGIHNHSHLHLGSRQQQEFGKEQIFHLSPEYYLIRIKNFNDIIVTPLDEWVYYLKNTEIKDEFTAKGIRKAKKAFSLSKLSENEQLAYGRFLYDLSYKASLVESSYGLGRLEGLEEVLQERREEEEGRKEGKEIGREEGKKRKALEIAVKMKLKGALLEDVMDITGLTRAEVERVGGV